MVEIELDGKKVSVAEGSMVMHAADAAGTYIPHFCYHKKLSIAANCRMCLVDVEKAPKPMPACATPVTNGMIVRTKSDKAVKAQKSVMEFLLINHPLDCPICDQGGECQLQDLAVGYGGSGSRYHEEKRVVLPKDVGPLISMQEMSRCIHCTRCVRFGQEVAGVMELGMVNRGEHAEITTIAGETIDSELSGNMIDICPVGALTSKPFRYSARTWELSRRKSVSPHDSTGTPLIMQVKGNEVMRVVPLEHEDINECWIADRDRFSYEALQAPTRLLSPMVKQGGQWHTVDWPTALGYVVDGLKRVTAEFGSTGVGALVSPSASIESLHLLGKLVRGLGSDNIDHRLRHVVSAPATRSIRWLGRSVASLSLLDRALVVGSFLRKDHPLFALRLRHAARHGAAVHSVGACLDDWLMPMGQRIVETPSRWIDVLADVAREAAAIKAGAASTSGTPAAAVAASLMGGQQKAILLGQSVAQSPDALRMLALAHDIAVQTGATVGWLGEGGNNVGAQWVGAMPQTDGLSAAQMMSRPMKALFLLDVDPMLDGSNAYATRSVLEGSGLVIAMTPFSDAMADVADVMLPIAPFAETSGSVVNAEGRLQSFHGVVKPRGETRPAWKVLRVMGNMLGLSGFDHESSEAVRDEAMVSAGTIGTRLDNTPAGLVSADGAEASPPLAGMLGGATLERIADVPIYAVDSLVRRAPALQATADAKAPAVSLPTTVWTSLGLQAGARVLVTQGAASATLVAAHDPTLAPQAVRVAAGRPDTASLGAMFGAINVRKAG